jgi:uncharacterized protein (TIGR04255 family)
MPFPKTEHVIYRNNTLQQVICQMRFPSILRIDTHIPVQFQESIRDKYPIYRERSEVVVNQIPQELMGLIPSEIKETLSSGKKVHEFISLDEAWTITLTRESIALTSTRYTRWNEFKTHFVPAFNALIECYSPVLISRIGLRYQNIIQRSKLGIDTTDWAELLQPYIAGPLTDKSLAHLIRGAFQTFEVSLGDEVGAVRIQHGLVDLPEGERCYLIDSDLFTEEHMEASHALAALDKFNKEGTRLFNWIITSRLHAAMEPEPPKTS